MSYFSSGSGCLCLCSHFSKFCISHETLVIIKSNPYQVLYYKSPKLGALHFIKATIVFFFF